MQDRVCFFSENDLSVGYHLELNYVQSAIVGIEPLKQKIE